MARPQKEGLDFFPVDVNMDEDDKILIIEADFGVEGFGILMKILLRIYRQHGYYMVMTLREQKLFAKRINVDINTVNAVINSAINENIFNKNLYETFGILTSKGIQNRYVQAVERRKSINLIKDYILIEIGVNSNINLVNVDNNSINDDKSTQRREEKSIYDDDDVRELPEKFFENNFHPITPHVAEGIGNWIEDGIDERLILQLMKEAVENNARTWNYVNASIRNHANKGVTTLEQYLSAKEERNRLNTKAKPKKKLENGFNPDEYLAQLAEDDEDGQEAV